MAKGNHMEHVTKIMPVLCGFIDKHKKCSFGITSEGGKLIVTIRWGKFRFRRFAYRDATLLKGQIERSLQAA